MSFSRSTWLGLIITSVIALFAMFARIPPRRWGKYTIFPLLIIAYIALLTVTFWEPVETRVAAQGRLEQASITERVSQQPNEALELIRRAPLQGVGEGQYTSALRDVLGIRVPSYAYQPVHNAWLLVAVELGIVGLILFSAFVVATLGCLLSSTKGLRQKLTQRNHIGAELGLPFIGLLCITPFDHYLWSLPAGLWLLGLASGLAIISRAVLHAPYREWFDNVRVKFI